MKTTKFTLLFTFVFLSIIGMSQSFTFSQFSLWPKAGQFEKCELQCLYSTDYQVTYNVIPLITIDSMTLKIASFKSYVPSINTNTRMCAFDADGNVSPYDISALPKQTLSVNSSSNTISISNGNTVALPSLNLVQGKGISITGAYPNYTISLTPPSIAVVNRTSNMSYTISTKDATVFYSISCSVTNPLVIGSSTASAFLEYSTNGGSTWNLATQSVNSSSVAVAVVIALTNGQTGFLGGVIPANAVVRIRTTTTGTASVGNAVGQEITY